jgi:hypothetical protein
MPIGRGVSLSSVSQAPSGLSGPGRGVGVPNMINMVPAMGRGMPTIPMNPPNMPPPGMAGRGVQPPNMMPPQQNMMGNMQMNPMMRPPPMMNPMMMPPNVRPPPMNVPMNNQNGNLNINYLKFII